MIIKSFLGETVAAALKQIRSELGPKAMVLKTRALGATESGVGRRMVEITACLERPTIGALEASFTTPQQKQAAAHGVRSTDSASATNERELINKPRTVAPIEDEVMNTDTNETNKSPEGIPDGAPGQSELAVNFDITRRYAKSMEADEFARRLEEKLDVILDRQIRPLATKTEEYSQQVSQIGQALFEQDIPDRHVRPLLIRLSERVKKSATMDHRQIAERMLVEEFAEHCYPELPLVKGERAVFVGPAGSGKTSILGKVAVKTLFKDKIKTRLSTLDDFRVAAQEEIAGYSEALGASLIEVPTQSASPAVKQNKDEITLIDCHSNVNDQGQFVRLQERIRIAAPDYVFLVVSALTRSADLTRLMRRFSALNPTHLIVTHTDLTDTVGGIYTAVKETGLPLVALSNAAGSMGALQSPDPAALARQALGEAFVEGSLR